MAGPGGCIRGRRSCRSPALSGLRPAHRAAGGPDTPAYAALARVADPAGLPLAYIEVAQLDMFRDEDLAYALRLGRAGVPVEFHLHPGAPHEFDFIAFNTTAARRHRRPRSFEHRMLLSLTGGCRAASPDK
ncbi:MAG: alpha/beta hydrolase fold domain-containing protein [Streptosporangiales bacterium]